MQTKIIIVLCFIALSNLVRAQDNSQIEVPTNNIKVIVIETSGKTTLKSTTSEHVHIASKVTKKGRVRGVQMPSRRPAFQVDYQIKADTLFITTPVRFSPSVIGIGTYRETIENTLEIPGDKIVVISKSDKIHFMSYFEKVRVDNARQVTGSAIQKDQILKLKCIAKENLVLNGKKNILSYELIGIGSKSIEFFADEIILTIQGQ